MPYNSDSCISLHKLQQLLMDFPRTQLFCQSLPYQELLKEPALLLPVSVCILWGMLLRILLGNHQLHVFLSPSEC